MSRDHIRQLISAVQDRVRPSDHLPFPSAESPGVVPDSFDVTFDDGERTIAIPPERQRADNRCRQRRLGSLNLSTIRAILASYNVIFSQPRLLESGAKCRRKFSLQPPSGASPGSLLGER